MEYTHSQGAVLSQGGRCTWSTLTPRLLSQGGHCTWSTRTTRLLSQGGRCTWSTRTTRLLSQGGRCTWSTRTPRLLSQGGHCTWSTRTTRLLSQGGHWCRFGMAAASLSRCCLAQRALPSGQPVGAMLYQLGNTAAFLTLIDMICVWLLCPSPLLPPLPPSWSLVSPFMHSNLP